MKPSSGLDGEIEVAHGLLPKLPCRKQRATAAEHAAYCCPKTSLPCPGSATWLSPKRPGVSAIGATHSCKLTLIFPVLQMLRRTTAPPLGCGPAEPEGSRPKEAG